MKKIAALFILNMLRFHLFAQTDTLPFHSRAQRDTFNKINEKRTSNTVFAHQTLNYSPLSYACPPFFDLGSPKKYYILSGDIIPEFIIASSKIPVVLQLTARYKVRVFHNNIAAGDSSFPVRTPSFMPGATLYIPLDLINGTTPNIRYLGLAYFHHSNGQDGPEFKNDGSFNLYNGNFSTNYIEPSFHFRRRKYTGVIDSAKFQVPERNYRDWYGNVGLEIHFNTDPVLKSSYGNQRVNFQLGYMSVINYWNQYKGHPLRDYYYGENYRIVFNATIIAGDRDHGLSAINKRINADLNYYWRIRGSPNTSLFVSSGYSGSDTYNIYYANSYFFIRAGIALGFFIAPNL